MSEDRRRFLGGSDAAAVMGLSPWATPVELWRYKTGRSSPPKPDRTREKLFKRGKMLEPYIIEMCVEKLRDRGHHVELVAKNQRYVDAYLPFLSCEVDFELLLDGEHINGDAKSVGGFARYKWGPEEDTEDVPIEYAAQFMHGLGITGRRRCIVAALMSLDDVSIYWVHRDQITIDAMRERCREFWTEHVVADVPPDPIKYSDVKALYPLDNGDSIEATDAVAEQVQELHKARSIGREAAQRAEFLEFQIAAYMQPHAGLTHNGRTILTWKGQERRELDAAALQFDHPGIHADYVRTATTRVMRIPATTTRKGWTR